MCVYAVGRFFGIVGLLLATMVVAGTVSAQVRGRVTPAQGVLPGQQVAIEFSGFAPRSQVIRWVQPPNDAAPIPFPSDTVSDSNGVAAWHYVVPDNAVAGTWAIAALAKDAPSGTPATTATFRVLPIRTTVANTASVVPTVGKALTSFNFQAPGFVRNQQVYAWANGPNDENVDLNLTIRADRNGVATWTWTAPADAAPGVWRMVIRDTPNPDEPLPPRYIVDVRIEP
jgi:hypothetical protein